VARLPCRTLLPQFSSQKLLRRPLAAALAQG
jgi:hypothetical protein